MFKVLSIAIESQLITEFLDLKNPFGFNYDVVKLHSLYNSNFVRSFILDKVKCKRDTSNIEIFLNHVNYYMCSVKIQRIEINKIY